MCGRLPAEPCGKDMDRWNRDTGSTSDSSAMLCKIPRSFYLGTLGLPGGYRGRGGHK